MPHHRFTQKALGIWRYFWIFGSRSVLAASIGCLWSWSLLDISRTPTFTRHLAEARASGHQCSAAEGVDVLFFLDSEVDQTVDQSMSVGAVEFAPNLSRVHGQTGWTIGSPSPSSGESGVVTVSGYIAHFIHIAAAVGSVIPSSSAGSQTLFGRGAFHRATGSGPVSLDLVGIEHAGPDLLDLTAASLGELCLRSTIPSLRLANSLAQNSAELPLASLEPSGISQLTDAADQSQLSGRTDGQVVMTRWTVGDLTPREFQQATV